MEGGRNANKPDSELYYRKVIYPPSFEVVKLQIIIVIILKITIMTRSSQKGKGSGGEREGKGVREGKGEVGKGKGERGRGKGERNCLDWTQNTRNTDWVIVRIAKYFCASLSQIWIPEIEYYQKVSSHA